MNRLVWFRILQVAVVAPYLYHVSNRVDSAYFRVGLKLVAGSIIMMNAKPLWQDYQNAQQFIAQLKEQMNKQKLPVIIEGESEPVNESA